MNFPAVCLKMCSSLPCFQVWAINPLISVLINSPIKNLDIERDKYNVGGVKLRSAHWDRANSNPREFSRAQPKLSEAVTRYFGGCVHRTPRMSGCHHSSKLVRQSGKQSPLPPPAKETHTEPTHRQPSSFSGFLYQKAFSTQSEAGSSTAPSLLR